MSTDDKGLGSKTTRDQVSIKHYLSTKGELIPRDQEVETEVSRQSPRGLYRYLLGPLVPGLYS